MGPDPAGADSPQSPPSLAPLPGATVTQYIRCGKATCHCREGEGHGPYHYRIWREGGPVHKVHVLDVDRVTAQCDLHRALARQAREAEAARAARMPGKSGHDCAQMRARRGQRRGC